MPPTPKKVPVRCQTCRRCVGHVVKEDQSRNGVRVIVTRHPGGTTVDASCSCFGSPMRVHSREDCPNRLRQLAGAS